MSNFQIDYLSTGVVAFFGLCIFIVFGAVLWVMIEHFKEVITVKWFNFMKWFRLKKNKIELLLQISKRIDDEFQSRLIEMIFQTFVNFYEKHFDEMEVIEYEKDFFPNGMMDISLMYKWVSHTRNDNYEELKNVVYDSDGDCLKYLGAGKFAGFKSRIDHEGRIHIHMLEEIDKGTVGLMYQVSMMRLQNSLYHLDSDKAQWIIERRKFFGM